MAHIDPIWTILIQRMFSNDFSWLSTNARFGCILCTHYMVPLQSEETLFRPLSLGKNLLRYIKTIEILAFWTETGIAPDIPVCSLH